MTDEERVELALAALGEVTDPADVGPLIDLEQVADGVVNVRFACTLGGYVDWRWTVSTADLSDLEPTVIEVELLPGDGSLLAPAWVPWTERLAEWRRQHPADAALADGEGLDDDEDPDGDDELDDDGDDELIDDDLGDDLVAVLEGADVEPDDEHDVEPEDERTVEPEDDDTPDDDAPDEFDTPNGPDDHHELRFGARGD